MYTIIMEVIIKKSAKPDRKNRYVQRHKNMNEDWTKSGIKTAGFYAKHVLWNKPTLKESIKDLNDKYKDIKFVLK